MGKRNNPLYCGKVTRTHPAAGQPTADKTVWEAKMIDRSTSLRIRIDRVGLQQNVTVRRVLGRV